MDFITECTDFSTYEGCLAAVRHHGFALQFVPEHMQTEEIYLAAVKRHGYSLRYIPEEMKTFELCLAAVHQSGYALDDVPDDMRTPGMCFAAIQSRGFALSAVPDHIKTYEMCLLAVRNDGFAIGFVPDHLRSDGIIDAALLEQPYLVQYPEFANYIKKTNYIDKTIIHHAEPKKMPEKAYDTLEMGYDEYSAIQDGELMVDFHKEFKHGRYYRKVTFEKFVLPSKKNPATREAITEYTIYKASV